jgi:nucleotide-binding universal stress UspA family protein
LKRILLLDQTLNPRALAVSYAIGLARKEGARLTVVCLVRPEADHTYWMAIQELLEEGLKEKVGRESKALVAACRKAGVEAEVLVGGGHPVAAMRQLTSKEKWDLLIVGETESVELGSAHLNAEDINHLSAELTSPVLTADAIRDRYRPYPKKEAMTCLAFAGAMAGLYVVFFHTYDWVKQFTLSATISAAAAILIFVPVVAFLGGAAAENLLKAFKFEAKH